MDKRTGVAPEESLRNGFIRTDRRGVELQYRFLSPTDDVGAITGLLHKAYAPLAEAGLRFVASHQDPEVSRRRMAKGDTIVAVVDASIIGIITLARTSTTEGVGELALDTSEQAEHLIRFYTSRGYRFVEFVRWPDCRGARLIWSVRRRETNRLTHR